MPLDAEPPDENLDVVRTSRDQESVESKGPPGEWSPDPHLSVVCPFPAQPSRQQKHRGNYRIRRSKYISASQIHFGIVHCHQLFHLPVEYRSGAKLGEIEDHLVRLVDRHGSGILGEFAVKLVIWPDPDGLYLIKGGGPKVWAQFPGIRKAWRTAQGIIHGKRCGTTQNIGPTARGLAADKTLVLRAAAVSKQ